jgi:hypothetical protein
MTSKKAPRSPASYPEAARINHFREWIAAAESDGHAASDLLLRLTARDAAALKRNSDVAVNEISFVMGEMRFLGVKVQEGGVEEASVLERPIV